MRMGQGVCVHVYVYKREHSPAHQKPYFKWGSTLKCMQIMKVDYDIYDYAQNNEPFHVIHLSLHIITKRKLGSMACLCVYVSIYVCSLLRCHIFPCCTIMKTMLYYFYAFIFHTVFPTFVSIFVENCFSIEAIFECVCVCVCVCFWIVNNIRVSSARLALQFSNRSSRKISA